MLKKCVNMRSLLHKHMVDVALDLNGHHKVGIRNGLQELSNRKNSNEIVKGEREEGGGIGTNPDKMGK